jgi:hypothetical protein
MKKLSPEEKVERALQQALDLTTADKPGLPWEHPDRSKDDRFHFNKDYPEWF